MIFNSLNFYINKLIKNKIMVRPIWKLNHLQKPYKNYQKYDIILSPKLIRTLICLPSSSTLIDKNISTVVKLFA